MAQVFSPKKAAAAATRRSGRRINRSDSDPRFQLFLIWVILILTDHLPPSSAHHHHHRSSVSSSRKAMLFRTSPPQLHAAVVSAPNQPPSGQEGNVYDEDKRIIHTGKLSHLPGLSHFTERKKASYRGCSLFPFVVAPSSPCFSPQKGFQDCLSSAPLFLRSSARIASLSEADLPSNDKVGVFARVSSLGFYRLLLPPVAIREAFDIGFQHGTLFLQRDWSPTV
ncbi:hypothetical protein L6452_13304 [Arctium lappa]|uniref:Uncharacterized protein n=1 Tax=Arctium lappa TaxID=4217 RepID=A0ACB9CHS7_ARCLA|nr:hypothetical protein L6452_13304 [Arctium lappa]